MNSEMNSYSIIIIGIIVFCTLLIVGYKYQTKNNKNNSNNNTRAPVSSVAS